MLQKKNRTVSCIIPTYKRTNTLYRAIESVRNQTYSNLEILVVNDNDKDSEITYKIKEYIEALNDDRIVLLQVEEHLNGARTRNIGINYSRGEYIAFLDDDDEWCESKIEKQINYFDNNNSVFGLTSQYTLYKNNKVLRTPVIQKSSDIHFD